MANGEDNITINSTASVNNINLINTQATDQVEATTPPTPSTAYDYNTNFTKCDYNNATNIDFNN